MKPRMILATAIVNIVSPDGQEFPARALIDQGSELSFVSESIVQTIHLPRRRSTVSLFGVGENKSCNTRGSVDLLVRSRVDPDAEYLIEAHILSRVTADIPSSIIHIKDQGHFADLKLADPSFATPGCIDVLLGVELYGQLLKGDIRKGPTDAPIAQDTTLGWIVSGPSSACESDTYHAHCISASEEDDSLHDLVKTFWTQEAVHVPEEAKSSKIDLECETHFESTHSRNPDGRYVVRLFFKNKPTSFGDSREIASRILERTARRFPQNPAFQKLYIDFLNEYESMGHMERINPPHGDDVFYLPHHGVLRQSSLTTKLRVVFNGSQKSNVGISLNDCLHAGPKLQQDLNDVILRWRTHAFVFSADVEKMYRQVLVHPDDRKYQLILWTPDSTQSPATYQLSTITYGLTSALYLAIRVMHKLASDEEEACPMAAPVVRNNFYVDDVLAGADTINEAEERARQVDGMLKAGGFCLQKWVTNNDRVLVSFEDSRKLGADKTFEDDKIVRALGLKWSHSTDSFIFTFHGDVLKPTTATKRTVLSIIARFFDTLGWLSPVIVLAKIFLQALWTITLSWDDPLPSHLTCRWQDVLQETSTAAPISIPRWLGTVRSSVVELHGFADASQSAIAAAVYVRVIQDNLPARCTLLVSKTKVAPVKRVTIARLELSASLLLTQLVVRIRASLDAPSTPIHMWTDSSISLYWIRGPPTRWKEYVGNRVALIQSLLPSAEWHHVPGVETPADIASRGLYPRQLVECSLWWNGPSWLSEPPSAWPNAFPPVDDSDNVEERPSAVLTVSTATPMWDLVNQYSSLDRLLRVTARVTQAANRFRGSSDSSKASNSVLVPSDLESALRFWVRATQLSYFALDIQTLRKDKSVPRSNHLAKLIPIIDEDGLMRVGGRLRLSNLEYDTKHPMLLPRKSALSTIVISDSHSRTFHGGTQLTLFTVRQKFWIVGGRVPVQAFIRQCVTCTRQRGHTLQQQMGQLPSSRLSPSRPFLNAGVDYAGPYHIKSWKGRDSKTYKAYLVVFVCFSTSAIHLELVTDCSTAGFIAAFRRFTSRRCVCATLWSDQGTNFIGADAELRKLFNETSDEFSELRNLLASDRTEWRFNPPSAPHFGGKWEAAVKSTKHHLRRVVGDTLLTYEEFSSLLIQVEGILNSRPLCPLSDDPSDFAVLTPGHILTGGPLNILPEPSLDTLPTSRLSRWQHQRQMISHFWRRWSREYLHKLQASFKWQNPGRQLQVGSLVLVTDERYPPTKWPLGRIVETHPGIDGLIRVVTVQTSNGSKFKRPIVKICPLPDSVVDTGSQEESHC